MNVASIINYGNDDCRRLYELSGEIARIATDLNHLAVEPADGERQALTASYVRGLINGRKARSKFFEEDLFCDPVWDIMLDLLAARLEHRSVSVKSLCIAAGVAPTTALRWINTLAERGLLERKSDPSDGRRVCIELTETAEERLRRCLSTIQFV